MSRDSVLTLAILRAVTHAQNHIITDGHVFAVLITCGYGLMVYDYTKDNTDENEEYLRGITLTVMLVETVKHVFELYQEDILSISLFRRAISIHWTPVYEYKYFLWCFVYFKYLTPADPVSEVLNSF